MVRLGSLTLIIELQSEAAIQLFELFEKKDHSVKKLGIEQLRIIPEEDTRSENIIKPLRQTLKLRAKNLGERQRMILNELEGFFDSSGYPPTQRELSKRTGLSRSVVANCLLELEIMEYIERDPRVARGTRLLKPLSEITGAISLPIKKIAQAIIDVMQIPLVGRIAAGELIPIPPSDFSYFDPDSMVEVARSLLQDSEEVEGLFALEVQGDSMIDAMVSDGDIVIMKPIRVDIDGKLPDLVPNGEMVAIWRNDTDETTLKYIYWEYGRIRLQPANPYLKPIFIDDPNVVEIKGKVVMVIRTFG